MSINTHDDWPWCSHPGFSVRVEAMDFYLIFEEDSCNLSESKKKKKKHVMSFPERILAISEIKEGIGEPRIKLGLWMTPVEGAGSN